MPVTSEEKVSKAFQEFTTTANDITTRTVSYSLLETGKPGTR